MNNYNFESKYNLNLERKRLKIIMSQENSFLSIYCAIKLFFNLLLKNLNTHHLKFSEIDFMVTQ